MTDFFFYLRMLKSPTEETGKTLMSLPDWKPNFPKFTKGRLMQFLNVPNIDDAGRTIIKVGTLSRF